MSEAEEVRKELVHILDKLLSKEYWDKTPFLVAAEKRLQALRDEFTSNEPSENDSKSKFSKQLEHEQTTRVVYVALYQGEGTNFAKWEKMLEAIGAHSISRPIYQNEDDIKEVFRSIDAKQNHAYIAVKIRTKDIVDLPEEEYIYDKMQHPLLLLRERAVSKLNIIKFVHTHGEYEFKRGKLIRTGDVSFYH